MQNKLNPWLDVCRSMAIMLVLLSHGRLFLTGVFPELNLLKFGGFLGVELFFVLSGFLIGRIILEKLHASSDGYGWIPSFWFRRWMRTYPSYVIFLFLNIFFIGNIRPESYPELLKFLTFTQSLLTPHPSFFGEAWSLAVEEVFYFITPLCIALMMRLTGNTNRALIISVILLLLLPFMARLFIASTTDLTFNQIRSTALLRIDSIMIGVLTCWAYYRSPDKWRKILPGVALMLLPLLALTVYIAAMPDQLINQSFILKMVLFDMAGFGCAGLIVSGMTWIPSKMMIAFSSRIARWSYAAYLTNIPVMLFIKYMMVAPVTLFSACLQWLVFVFLTLFTAFVVYTIFEVRVLRIRDVLLSR